MPEQQILSLQDWAEVVDKVPACKLYHCGLYKKEWLAHYGVQSEDQLWKKFNGFATNSAITALAPQSSDEIKRVEAKIDSYLKTNLPKLWFAKTDEEFNQVKEQMRADIKKMPDYDKEVAFGKDSIAKIKELIKPYN